MKWMTLYDGKGRKVTKKVFALSKGLFKIDDEAYKMIGLMNTRIRDENAEKFGERFYYQENSSGGYTGFKSIFCDVRHKE